MDLKNSKIMVEYEYVFRFPTPVLGKCINILWYREFFDITIARFVMIGV